MFAHRSSRRRRSRRQSPRFAALRTHASLEVLESRQLLSATGSAAVVEQTFVVSEDTAAPGYSISIEEIHVVDNEIWILSRLSSPDSTTAAQGPVTDAYLVTDEVTVAAPEFPRQHFRIGGSGDYDGPGVDRVVTPPIRDVREFHALLEGRDAELIYSRTDPALSAWREAVREKLLSDADAAYGDLFGQETSAVWLPVIGDIRVGLAEADLFDRGITTGEAASLTFSETNVQVAGVDEGDIVETDGQYLYILTHGELVIVRTIGESGEAADVVSRTQLNGYPSAMFLHNGRLTVIATGNSGPEAPPVLGLMDSVLLPRLQTTVSVFDVTNAAQPSLVQQTIVDGAYVNARAIGDDVYVVVNNSFNVPYLPGLKVVFDGFGDDGNAVYRYQTRDEFLQTLDSVVERSTPPGIYRDTISGDPERIGWLNDSFLDTDFESVAGSQTNVLKFNVTETNPGPVDNVSIPVGSGWGTILYASQDAIYLLTNEYQQVEVDGRFWILDQSQPSVRITKVSLTGERMLLEASGSVRGTVHDQFSVDEFDGYLRVATTTAAFNGVDSENNLYVLEQTGDALNVVGSVEGIAPTETIYAMRFDGDRAWMVTFRRVDPVYSFDLSDPTNPRVTGELKIPGFSDYLQLIDENLLLAVGRGADDNDPPGFGLFQEVQVSLFDVSDMANPILLHRYSFEGGRSGQSEALVDHHAFNYIADRQLLAVPFSNPEVGTWTAGLIMLHVDPINGFEVVSDIDQPGSVRRSVRVEEYLYAISEDSISVIDLGAPDTVIESVELNPAEDPGPGVDPPSPEPNPIEVPIVPQTELVQDYVARTQDVFVTRFTGEVADSGLIYIGSGLRPDDWNSLTDADAVTTSRLSYEFRILDPDSGAPIQRLESQQSVALLHDPSTIVEGRPAGGYSGPAQVLIQVRTRDNSLRNGSWSNWSEAALVRLFDERPVRTSPDELSPEAALLKWSTVADRGSRAVQVTPAGAAAAEKTQLLTGNPVSHYEVWVSSENSRQPVLLDRHVESTQLDVGDLSAGRYSVWFRAVFADGTRGDWSSEDRFSVLGAKLRFRDGVAVTANVSPLVHWENAQDAISYEIEAVSEANAEVVTRAAGLSDPQYGFPDGLPAGISLVRVRAALSSGVVTEWSDTYRLTIADRPDVTVLPNGFTWSAASGAQSFEVWIANAVTGERINDDAESLATFNTEVAQGGTGALAGATITPFAPGRYHAWVKASFADGSATQWSQRATLAVYGDAVFVDPIGTLLPGQPQAVSWQPIAEAASYEIYVRQVGQSDPAYRLAGIAATEHVIEDDLNPGEYQVWVRAVLTSGGQTRWGWPHAMAVSDTPSLSVDGVELSWATSAVTTHVELWINEVSARGTSIRARVVHLTDLTDPAFDAGSLSPGRYSAWVRAFRDTPSGTVASAWSARTDFQVADASLGAVFENDIDSLLLELDAV
ncbi:MAG: beta-propeller domain-containing protein [Planctomycetaceae bacterium]